MITIEQVMSWEPCYPQERVEELFAGREVLTIEDVFNLDIPAEHKLWVLLREELIPAPVLHEFACRVAEQTLALLTNPDPRSVAAIAAKRAWLKGEITAEQLREARQAAWTAAEFSAITAAWPAVRFAAYYAADTAASAVARATARSAAEVTTIVAVMFADESADYRAACNSQLELLKTLIKETSQETA
jgi:hypothetical protein